MMRKKFAPYYAIIGLVLAGLACNNLTGTQKETASVPVGNEVSQVSADEVQRVLDSDTIIAVSECMGAPARIKFTHDETLPSDYLAFMEWCTGGEDQPTNVKFGLIGQESEGDHTRRFIVIDEEAKLISYAKSRERSPDISLTSTTFIEEGEQDSLDRALISRVRELYSGQRLGDLPPLLK